MLAGVGLLVLAAVADLGEAGDEIVVSLGGALLVAGVLGATVDAWLKHQLLRDAFQATFGYLLPAELRDELAWIYEQDLVCMEHEQEVVIEPADDPDLVLVRTRVRRVVRNVSTHRITWDQTYAIDDWQLPGPGPDITELSVTKAGETFREFDLERPEELVLLARPRTELRLDPGEEVVATAVAVEPNRASDDMAFVLSQPTRTPRVTVRVPAGFGFRVYFGSRDYERLQRIDDETLELPGTLLPGQLITVRWWREAVAAG
jgi:hypothetical protein